MDRFKLVGRGNDGGQMLLVFTMRGYGGMTSGNGFLSNGFVFVSNGLFALFSLRCGFVLVHDGIGAWRFNGGGGCFLINHLVLLLYLMVVLDLVTAETRRDREEQTFGPLLIVTK